MSTIIRRTVRVALFGAVATGGILLAGTTASASPGDWELTDSCTPSAATSCVGGAPSYDGVPGLILDLSAQTGISCWSTDWYLATDGYYYNYQCF